MAWNSLKTITAHFRRGTVLWSDKYLTAQGLKAERGQSGTSAVHEWISRVVRKFHMLGFPRMLHVVSQLKNLVRAGKGGLSPVSCLLCELKCRRRSCASFCIGSTNLLGLGCCGGSCQDPVCASSSEHTCTELGTSWVAVNAEGVCANLQGRLGMSVGRAVGGVLEGQHWKDCVDPVSSCMFGQQFSPFSRGFSLNLVCIAKHWAKEVQHLPLFGSAAVINQWRLDVDAVCHTCSLISLSLSLPLSAPDIALGKWTSFLRRVLWHPRCQRAWIPG